MAKRIFVGLLALLLTLGLAAFSGAESLEVRGLESLNLPGDLAARVSELLPAKPGDTFLKLRNGMTVLVRENHASRVVSCRVLVKTGSIYEGPYFFGGISHYLEHVVAGGSTSSFSEAEAQKIVRSLGGASNAYTGYANTVYFIDTTTAHYRQALELLLSYVSECRLEPAEVAREKAVIQQEFRLRETSPEQQLWQLFLKTAYLKHPIRHPVIGYEDVFVKIGRPDLLKYYHQWYTPQNMVVAVVGDLRAAEAVRTVLELSRNMRRNFQPARVTDGEPAQSGPRLAEKSLASARLSSMLVGFHTVSLSHPDIYPLDLLAVVLGKGRSSRLYQELKDRRRLALSVDAFSWTPAYAPGLFGLSLSLRRQQVEPALAVLWQQIRRLQRELVKVSELEKAKRRIIADFVFGRQTAAQMATSLASSFAATGDPYFDSHYVARIKAVSSKDLRRVARIYLRRKASTVAIVSPPQRQAHKAVTSALRAVEPIKKLALKNGLTLLLKRNPAAPLVYFQIFGLGGQLFEPKGQEGISLFTTRLLTKGTRSRSKQQIAEIVEALGGRLNSGSGRNTYHISLAMLKQDCKTGLELMADIAQHASFPQEEIEKQRQDTLLAIRRLDEDWQEEVERLFRLHYYRHHPYGRDLLGREASVKRISRAMVKSFYRRMVMPNDAVLAIFGDIDAAEVVKQVERLFGKWQPGKMLPAPAHRAVVPLTADARIQKKTEKGSAAIFVGTAGLTLQDPDRPVLDVIDAVLSGIGYPSGWLHDALRGGKHSLVYVVHAFPSYGMDCGHFGVITQTTMANYRQVVRIILAKLARIQHQPLEAEELEAAKDMCITMHEINLESCGAQARSAALNQAVGLGYDWDHRYPGLIRQVRPEDVVRVARRLFRHYLLVSTIPERPVETIKPPERQKGTVAK